MSAADQIQQKMQQALQGAEVEAHKADAASELAMYEEAKEAYEKQLEAEAKKLREIKPEKICTPEKEGQSAAVKHALGMEAKSMAEAKAQMQRAEQMQNMYPIARERDQVVGALGAAKARLQALMGQRGDTA